MSAGKVVLLVFRVSVFMTSDCVIDNILTMRKEEYAVSLLTIHSSESSRGTTIAMTI